MKCETCTEYLTEFEFECFDGVCDKCHEKHTKEYAEFLKEKENEN